MIKQPKLLKNVYNKEDQSSDGYSNDRYLGSIKDELRYLLLLPLLATEVIF